MYIDPHTAPHFDTSALLTIDLQQDFLSDGASAVPGTTEVLSTVQSVIEEFRQADRPVIHVTRLYETDGSNADRARRTLLETGAKIVRPGTAGSQLAPGLLPRAQDLDVPTLLRGEFQLVAPNEYVMYKPRWNAFYGTQLDSWLRDRGVDTVVIVGCNFPNCPRGTVFGASERDFRIVVVSDALSGWTSTAAKELASIGAATVDSLGLADAMARTREGRS